MWFRPGATLDRLILERRMGASWGATAFLAGMQFLVLAVVTVVLTLEVQEALRGVPEGGMLVSVAWFYALSNLVSVLISAAITFVVSRYFFVWFVIGGLRIVAGDRYPQDPAERKEKARLLQVIQPYTLGVSQLPLLLLTLPLPFLIDLSPISDFLMIGDFQTEGLAGLAESLMPMMLLVSLWFALYMLIGLGLLAYMTVIRVKAILRIYDVSTAQAFWGPFLIYAGVYVIGWLLYFGLMMLMQMMFAFAGQAGGTM